MKILVAILATAIVSVGVTLIVVDRKVLPERATRTQSTTLPPKPSKAWLDLKKESDKLDAELRETTRTDAKNAKEASIKLKAYEYYCDAEMELFSREEALYEEEHNSEDSPVLMEQKEATAAWCDSNKALTLFMSDPKNGYRVDRDEIFATDATTYNRLLLEFRVASVRLVNANAAEAQEETR